MGIDGISWLEIVGSGRTAVLFFKGSCAPQIHDRSVTPLVVTYLRCLLEDVVQADADELQIGIAVH